MDQSFMKPAFRRRARKLAVQALYQWEMAKASAAEIETQFLEREDLSRVDVNYFRELVAGVISQFNELDKLFQPYLDRAINELTIIERCVLRLATFELAHRLDVPFRVVINEALELTKIFGTIDGFKYVNGVLDQAAKILRPLEPRKV